VHASIDIGSNTVRLLLGSVENRIIIPSLYVRRITRLKGGQTESGLTAEAMGRTFSALKEFSEIIAKKNVIATRVVGTEALRSAPNRQQFVSMLFKETGLNLEIISGDEEALLTTAGVCSAFVTSSDFMLVFDIGGGSTEFILLHQGDIVFQTSCRLGVVDLTESLSNDLKRENLISSTVTSVLNRIEPILERFKVLPEAVTLVGTAGTVTTLAAINFEMTDYDWRKINGSSLDISVVESIYKRLAPLSVSERESIPGMEKGRGDLLSAGIEIILKIMRQFHSTKLTVSDFGLLEGILLSMQSKYRPND